MSRLALPTAVFLASLLGAPPAGPGSCLLAEARAEDGWRVIHEQGGLTVASRAVPPSRIDEVRATATFNLPIEAILAVLADVEHYPGNLPPTSLARRIRGDRDDAWFYMEINPSMVSRRYYCTRSRVSRQGEVVRVEWSLANDVCPARQPGMVRMEDNAGAWTLTPLGAGRTRLVYQAHADPGGSIPASIVNLATGRAVVELFASLQKATARTQLNATR